MKKLSAILLTVCLGLSLCLAAGCQNEENKGDVITIGILQIDTHTALDGAKTGFKEQLDAWAKEKGKTIKYTENNAHGDNNNQTTLAATMVASKPDMLLGISTGSAQALAANTTKIPVLFTAVTDPKGAGLTADNVTGTSDLNPVSQQIQLVKDICGDNIKKIAFLYCSSETNSQLQVSLAEKECEKLKIEHVSVTAGVSNEIQTAVESIGADVDAVFIPTDNLMAANMNLVCSILNAKKIPCVAGEAGMCEDGEALATLGLDYVKLGKQTALIAIKVLEGKACSDLPFEFYAQESSFFFNDNNAATLKIDSATVAALKAKYNV